MEDLAKKYMSFCEDVVSATLLNPELQAKMQELTLATWQQFSACRDPETASDSSPNATATPSTDEHPK